MSIVVSHARKRLYGVTEWVVSILQKLSLTRVWLCIVSQHIKINIVYETVPIFNMYHYWYFLNYPFVCLFEAFDTIRLKRDLLTMTFDELFTLSTSQFFQSQSTNEMR